MRRDRQFGAERMQFLEIEFAARGSICSRSVPRITSAVTNGLPSRSPPIQLPILRNDASSPCARRLPCSAGPPARNAAAAPRAGRCNRRTTSPLATSSSTVSLVRRSRLVCHSVSTSRRNCSSLASISSGVSWTRSRRSSSAAISISRSIVLLRRTSVGCAVRTGPTSALPEELAQIGGAEAGLAGMRQRLRQRARRRRSAGGAARASGGCCSGPRRCWRDAKNS